MLDDPPLPLDAAFAPRTRAALAAAPATRWAADLTTSTCMALLWAVDECFIVGSPCFERTTPLLPEVDDTARAICARVLSLYDARPAGDGVLPRADAGFSDELVRAWIRHKHLEWATRLTADALAGLLAALDGCPAPPPDPTIYTFKPIARAMMAQQSIAEIVRGAALTWEQFVRRFFDATGRPHDVSAIVENLADELKPRVLRLLRQEFPRHRAMDLLYEPRSQFRGMSHEAFMRQLHANVARVRGMSDADLVARIKAAGS